MISDEQEAKIRETVDRLEEAAARVARLADAMVWERQSWGTRHGRLWRRLRRVGRSAYP